MKNNFKYILFTCSFVLLSVIKLEAQVNSNGAVNNTVLGENPFLDMSDSNTDNGVANNNAKGLYFPRTDLTTWTFNTAILDGITFASAYDGMIVYNTGTGTTIAGQGIQVTVSPGFYYFNNPVALGSTDISGGQWNSIGSNNKGFMLPKFSHTNVISNPEEGLMIYDVSKKCMRYYNGIEWSGCTGGVNYYSPTICDTSTTVVEVTNVSGAIWMDRNLGASQQATSSSDVLSYGDLYQWGRFPDGHQCRSSLSTTDLATTSIPNLSNSWDGLFIIQPNDPQDWLAIHEDDLWQDANAPNNPCPSGYRIPTKVDFLNEGINWSSLDATGAFASPLKFPTAGGRSRSTGAIYGLGTQGVYWSSTIASEAGNSYVLYFNGTVAGNGYYRGRAGGNSVRCIKD